MYALSVFRPNPQRFAARRTTRLCPLRASEGPPSQTRKSRIAKDIARAAHAHPGPQSRASARGARPPHFAIDGPPASGERAGGRPGPHRPRRPACRTELGGAATRAGARNKGGAQGLRARAARRVVAPFAASHWDRLSFNPSRKKNVAPDRAETRRAQKCTPVNTKPRPRQPQMHPPLKSRQSPRAPLPANKTQRSCPQFVGVFCTPVSRQSGRCAPSDRAKRMSAATG
jgi:hypothetical protein